jgi:tetratricopeptide (TPR) repeat protein
MNLARIGLALVLAMIMSLPAHALRPGEEEEACQGHMGLPLDEVIAACSDLIRGAPLVDARANGPGRYNIMYLRALAYAAKQDHERAVDDFSQVIRFLPDRANAYLYRARSLIALGRTQEAEQDKAAYAKLRPNGNRLSEDCLPVDWQAIEVVKSLGDWAVVQPAKPSGRNVLMNYGGNKEMAERAAAMIKSKRYDRHCFVARPYPPLNYWTAAGNLASHQEGDDGECIAVDNASLALTRKNGALEIVDSKQTVLVTGYDELVSQQVLAVLRALKVTRKCTIRVDNDRIDFWKID